MKSPKGEGQKSSQVKGGLASGDREPLFPRLHVNETEKAGPKAPPRNKMALYEQFTVPSHRFVQPTQTSPIAAFHQPYGSGYPYMPYYIPSVPYANANNNVQAYPQPSQVTNSSGVTGCSMVVNEESRKAHRLHQVGNLPPCKVPRGLKQASAECIKSDAPEQRAKVGSSLTNYTGEPTKSFGNAPTERPYTLDSLHEAMSTLKEGLEVMHQRCDGREGSKLLSSDVSVPLNLSTPSSKPTKEGILAKLPTGGSGCKQDSLTQTLTADGHSSMLFGTFSEHRSSEDCGAILATDRQNLSSMEGRVSRFSLTSVETSITQSHYSALQTSPPDVRKEGISRGVNTGNPDIRSVEELNKKHEVSPAHSGGHSEHPADVTPVIKPKDVILEIGQQQFWKARKTLLRQQRIFSDQVFQLHKLIMVQQLLAETPGILIDEAVHFEMLEECDAPPAAALLPKRSSNPCDSKKVNNSQLVDAEGSRAASKDAKKEVKVSIPDSVQGGGISAWGYPSFGQWIGPMAAQGQPYGCQPLAGTFPPGSAFGLPYGLGPASPVVSFAMPYCGQRQELPAEMGSNYGPVTASNLDGRNVGHNVGHFSNGFGGSWYFMPHNNVNPQMIHSAGSGKDAPTGSGTSVNKAPKTAAQGVKTSCFPGLSHHWGINNQGARPSNTEGLESSGQQSEMSSPSIATRLNTTTTPITPSVPTVKKLGFSHKDSGKIFDSTDFRRSLVDKEDVDARACAKVCNEGGSPPVADVSVDASVHLSNVGECALELFPLVPSLSSGGRIGKRDPKAAEGGGGHVIRAVPRQAIAALESAAGILLSLQRERQK